MVHTITYLILNLGINYVPVNFTIFSRFINDILHRFLFLDRDSSSHSPTCSCRTPLRSRPFCNNLGYLINLRWFHNGKVAREPIEERELQFFFIFSFHFSVLQGNRTIRNCIVYIYISTYIIATETGCLLRSVRPE